MALFRDCLSLNGCVQVFPAWQVLLVDLRCHGDSASLHPQGPHGVEAAAGDIIRLLSRLRLFPEVLLGHSFGVRERFSFSCSPLDYSQPWPYAKQYLWLHC